MTVLEVTEQQLEYHGVYLAFIAAAIVLAVVAAVCAAYEVLTSSGPAPTPPAFQCPECGAQSWHPEDGRQGYCGRCRSFTGRPAGLDIPDDDRRIA